MLSRSEERHFRFVETSGAKHLGHACDVTLELDVAKIAALIGMPNKGVSE